MNIGDSDAPRSCTVKSKYFSAGSAMDESLSDFQEPKKSCAGPKKTVNNSKTSKPRKATKRPRGQKDIRTALKSTKKDLVSYSKDFDKVCKKAGIDIDSEELQLAIALSKSLQNTPSSSNDSGESSQTSTIQGRIGKIRTTLQEYGFKVPEIKIVGNICKASRKYRKDYKLMQTSVTEKNEIIADKYSQILFQDISHGGLNFSEVDTSCIPLPLYCLASNASYDILKLTDTYYINNLIKKSTSNGNLLRDWSTIPGRPESPKLFEPMSMNFNEMECSQDELDIVLSGTLSKCRNIVSKKIENRLECKTETDITGDENTINFDKTLKESMKNDNQKKSVTSEKKHRSYSPDMFDDDASDLFDDSKSETDSLDIKSTKVFKNNNINSIDLTQSAPENPISKPNIHSNTPEAKSNDLMELTDCIRMSQKKCLIINETPSHLSQNSEVTKRKSNYVMEITECVDNSSHLNNKNTRTPEMLGDDALIHEINTGKTKEQQRYNETNLESNDLDLTESYVLVDETEPTNINTDNHLESMDLTQSSNSSDELPYITLTGTSYKSLDDTLIVDINDYAHINKKTTLQTDVEVHIDLTQCVQRENGTSIHSQSFFEEFDHDHSEGTEDDKESSGTVDKENTNEVNTSRSPRNIINKEKFLGAKNNDKHCILSLSASRIEVETIPVEKHPANNLRYPKPGNIDLTIENEDKICLVVAEQEPDLQDTSDNANLIQDYINEIDLTKNSKMLNVSNHCNKDTTPKVSKGIKSNSFSNLQDPVDDIDLTQHSDESNNLSQISIVIAPDITKDYDVTSDKSRIKKTNKSRDQEKSNRDTTNINDLPSLRSLSSLGKKDDMSIDYDEFTYTAKSGSMVYETPNNSKEKFSRKNSMLSNCSQNSEVFDLTDKELDYSLHQSKLEIPMVYETPNNSKQKFSRNNSMLSNCSQNSEVFDLTDKELDYSLHQSKLEVPNDNFEFGGISVMDELSNLGHSKKSIDTVHNSEANFEFEYEIESYSNVPNPNGKKINRCKGLSPIKHRRLTEIATPQKPNTSMVTVTTPKNSELLIKTNNVTPMTDYESMATPDLHKELDKYGIKPFKRKRAIQLLTHIYIQTHPLIENADELASPPKRHKPNNYLQSSPKKLLSPRKLIASPRRITEIDLNETLNEYLERQTENDENNSNLSQRNGISKGKGKGKRSRINQKENHVTIDIGNSQKNHESLNRVILQNMQSKKDEAVVIKEIECNPEDWVFQKREKSKVHSCRVPLHIAFYNYVSSRRDLHEAILSYEPVEIDVIHKDLVSYGYRYDPKDLLKFLDKKCITVKTTDNNGRNQKR